MYSATQTFVEIVEEYLKRNVRVCIVKLRTECRVLFERSGLVDIIGSEHFYGKIQEAVQAITREVDESDVVVIESSPSSPSRTNFSSTLPFRRALPKTSTEEFVSFPARID